MIRAMQGRKVSAILLAVLCLTVVASAQSIKYASPGSNLGDTSFPPLQKFHVQIAAASYGNAFTSPITLISGISNKLIVPEKIWIHKAAGSAWTPGAGSLSITWTGSGSGAFGIPKAGFFDQTTAEVAVGTNSQFNSYMGSFHAVKGTDVTLALTTANMSGGTGAMDVTLWYRVWDATVPAP